MPARAVSSEELAALQAACPGASVLSEGNNIFVHLPRLRISSGGQTYETDALLLPHQAPEYGGYTTRLFLSSPTPKPVGWTTVTALGRTWSTWSWNNVPATDPLIEILGNHVKALND
jgi:hypothetical protein